jgi:hypothetical protein
MLYWICPECGHECSPAIRECPTCTAPPTAVPLAVPLAAPLAVKEEKQQTAATETDAGHELLSLAQNFQVPSAALLGAAPQRQLLAASNGHETSISTTSVAVEAAPPEPPKKLAPLDILGIRPAKPARITAVKLSPAPMPVRISSPAVATREAVARLPMRLQSAGPVPAGEIRFEAARGVESGASRQVAEPLPSQRQTVALVRAGLPTAGCGEMAVAELAPTRPALAHQNGHSEGGASTPLVFKPSGPAVVFSRLKLTGEPIAELRNALQASAEEIDRAGIQAIQASFAQQPVAYLLAAPEEIVTAPAPPAAQWMRSAKPKFTPIAPESTGRAAAIAGPQAPPLAGPSLPPQLLNLDRQNTSLRPRRRWSLWPVSFAIVTVLILGIVSVLTYSMQDRDTKAASVAAPAQTAKASTAPPLPVIQEHPAARSVEVAGIRVLTGPNKKPQLQFIVINHSVKELTGLNIRIAVRSVDALADGPLFTVSSLVASLGPNQSKEIRTDVSSSVHPSDIPDWQSLRTEVLIGRQ